MYIDNPLINKEKTLAPKTQKNPLKMYKRAALRTGLYIAQNKYY
jgi:hypothetical protein